LPSAATASFAVNVREGDQAPTPRERLHLPLSARSPLTDRHAVRDQYGMAALDVDW
jgi:hypothetical protein